MKRFIRFIAVSVGLFLAVCVAVVIVSTLAVGYRFDLQIRSISKKLAPVVISSPQIVWDRDLRPFGFPQNDFDSPYVAYAAPTTVAMSDSQTAVVFRKSHYVGNKLVIAGGLIVVLLASGSVVTTTAWPGSIGVGPYVFCCTTDAQFYVYADNYFAVKDGQIAGKQASSPVGPSTQKVKVSLGTNLRPSSIEIVREDQSKSSFQTDCGNVGDSYISKDTLVVIGCSTLSIIGTDGHLFFSDTFNDADLKFGGASKNGKRFVISVTAWHPGDPPYLTDEWLVVYDIERREPVFAVKSDPLPYMQSQSALSADGNRLLIGSGGHLKLISVFK